MKKTIIYTSLFILVLLKLSTINLAVASVEITDQSIFEPNLEWKVSVGDVKQFTYRKVYDLYDSDEDGNPNTQRMYAELENGTETEITITSGSTLSCEILALDEYATIQITINGIELDPQEGGGGVLMKTTDNKTYWEEIASQISDEHQNVSVEGNLLVHRSKDSWSDKTFVGITKTNWKTGWLEYVYSKETNSTHILREMEITTGGTPGLIPGFEIAPLYVPLIVLATLFLRKRNRKDFTCNMKK